MPVSPAGQKPVRSTTAPAGRRESSSAIHPAELRRRTTDLVNRSAELGRRMRRADAYRLVVASSEVFDCSADGWNAWLSGRFDPTRDAAIANLSVAVEDD